MTTTTDDRRAMPDQTVAPTAGPDQYWSTDLPPSRGQYQTIAILALDLLGVAKPEHRLDASIAISRLRQALLTEHAPAPVLPQHPAF